MTLTENKISIDYYSNKRKELLRYITKNNIRVLDVGCGAGTFGEYLKKKRKAEVWGIEIVPEIAEKAKGKIDYIFCGRAEDIIKDLPDNHFDLICFNDVLEHIMWPEDILNLCKSKLNPEGEILCSLPNMRYFRVIFDLVFKKNWEYEECGIMDRTHIRFFTINSIKNMFTRCGYEILQFEGTDTYNDKKTTSWRYRVFLIITLWNCHDMLHGQFFCRARPKSTLG